MSFTFRWPRFSDQFHYDAIEMLNTALNKGNKPPIIADKIEVVELEMGTQPPELEIRDIGDLTMDQFRGIFRLTYAGDAHLVLKTKVQANPLNHKQPDIHLMAGSRGMLAAKQALVVPMLLRLSHFKLSSYVVLVVSKQKGITLVFKTDPLQSVDINSTFDSIAVIQMFIQREIEGQLRQMFREDLPGIIHRLSQQWVKAKVETPTAGLTQRNVGVLNSQSRVLSSAPPSLTRHNVNIFNNSVSPTMPRTASVSRTNVTRKSVPPTPPVTPAAPLNGDEEPPFDPTYGLRPDGIRAKGVFREFRKMFSPGRGLADLTESEQESVTTDDFETTYDILEWGETPSSRNSATGDDAEHDRRQPEYDRIPAVGYGTILRPRIFHSQSQPHSLPRTRSVTEHTLSHPRPELPHNPFSAAFAASTVSPPSSRSTSPSPSHTLSTPPSSSSAYQEPQPLTVHSIPALEMLSHAHSRNTLSPYTRSLAHFVVRSAPPRPPVVGAGMGVARKGRRRRTHRINGGGAKPPSLDTEAQLPSGHALYPDEPSPMSPSRSDFDVREMDMYFRHMDMEGDSRAEHSSPNIRPSHIPLRHKVSSLAMSTPG
ncbi:Mitochondrial distribution and morphology protein 34 [Mycena sanguinolenta]|uniref:Mitochondrial distribution and morphology protein 34 n=1 Tax=Mycena sanguinolenta TaxID=230812 RepID=A0A8H7CYX9_9AGAR|nr:Mitochondrial distribution and morphology protein 34 [Mycena sanguinolenta]